jgi:large subunit ribosomal protein L15
MRNTLTRIHKNKKSRQIGRGGAKAKTAGRGTKGQNARAGRKKRPELRDFIKRIPKLRGRGKNLNTSIQDKYVAVNLSTLLKVFPKGGVITPATLIKASVVEYVHGAKPKVKIVGNTPVSVPFTVSGCATSLSAKAMIEKASGSVK